MEHINNWASRAGRKRKLEAQDKEMLNLSSDELNEDLLERVLSWLPTSAFFRAASVCKRWKSVSDSASFKLACSEIPSREPWFLMVDPHLNQSTIFDSAERSWKKLNYPPLLQQSSNCDSIPVAASGGLVCFHIEASNFIVCNPVTGSCRELLLVHAAQENHSLLAVAMNAQTNQSYKLVLVSGELPNYSCKVYNSSTGFWGERILLRRKVGESQEFDSKLNNAVYFLSKAGKLVATDMQRSPSKQYSSVITVKDGERNLFTFSSSGTIVSCNLTTKCFSEYPRLLPVFCEYSIDIVAMPQQMSHEFYGKKVDINCVGAGDRIFICLNSAEFFRYVVCDLRTNEWTELPKCFKNGEAVEFMSAFSFEPRIEASV
uniref:F-box domain-containing protein n=1 Tax=Salix viminalis TaxID=40686 RepID=A0A6N2LG88_SALVM